MASKHQLFSIMKLRKLLTRAAKKPTKCFLRKLVVLTYLLNVVNEIDAINFAPATAELMQSYTVETSIKRPNDSSLFNKSFSFAKTKTF